MMRLRRIYPILFALLLAVITLAGCGGSARDRARGSGAQAEPPVLFPVLLHLPGIGGERAIDQALVDGLAAGGISAETEIYDWTDGAPGISALVSRQRNDAQAQIVADWIARRYREDPRRTIHVTGHSGGCAIAVWALEKLPGDVRIDSLTLLAPALSPEYDLAKALSHVRGRAYCFYSRYDPVLGLGTRLFGTIDGVKTEAAGRVAFVSKNSIDETRYDSLEQIPYDPAWEQVGHIGDHIGTMNRPFARRVLAPLILTGTLPVLPPIQPATTSATRPATRTAGK